MRLMKSDGNGGLVIPHWFVIVLSVSIALISSVAGVVAVGMTIKSDVDYLKNEWLKAEPIYNEAVNELEDKIDINEKDIAIMNVHYEDIKEDIRVLITDVDSLKIEINSLQIDINEIKNILLQKEVI